MSRPLQERDVIPTRGLVLVAAAAVLVTLVCLLWVHLVLGMLGARAAPPLRSAALPAVDRALYGDGAGGGAVLKARQRALLESGRVPIERAMQQVTEAPR